MEKYIYQFDADSAYTGQLVVDVFLVSFAALTEWSAVVMPCCKTV
jgi:hypothetical protein